MVLDVQDWTANWHWLYHGEQPSELGIHWHLEDYLTEFQRKWFLFNEKQI